VTSVEVKKQSCLQGGLPTELREVLVEVVRSGFVESVHTGSLVVVDPLGAVRLSVGSPEAPVFPRSSNKPLQAVALLECGADLDGADLALAAASHSGEPEHVRGVRALLASVGLDETALGCPPDLPLGEAARENAVASGARPQPVTMNCSGKHAGMLVGCVRAGWPTTSYKEPDHPLQRAARRTVERLAGEPVAVTGVDGCGAPLFALSLVGLARAMSRLVTATPGSFELRVADAMRAHPFLVAGSGREDTLLMQAVPGLLSKSGWEGVHVAVLPDGTAFASKIDDGAPRGRLAVLLATLRYLGVQPSTLDALPPLPGQRVMGGGRSVGLVRLRAGIL
jgi:L-asparaginase II